MATGIGVTLCLAVSLVHVLLVFLHIAPTNRISQHYGRQINGWIYPLFEQNWRLFAPNPESVNQRISARTMGTSADGGARVSGWFDLTAVDTSAVEHNPFPSHTAQNTLRRAWTAYLETHGGQDEPRSERALILQEYLRNIAAERVRAHRPGDFTSIQLRVVTQPIAASRPEGGPAAVAPAPVNTRYLPWWKVTPHAG
ncbi:DUF5819 family protein [Streptomyces albus]|uniref:DUF5819 family protein n=1 Tax=Streptomyces albus TaxID=1888 RepID=UPI00056282C2|nr:DUF5819 family protein [Streptomyces albus]